MQLANGIMASAIPLAFLPIIIDGIRSFKIINQNNDENNTSNEKNEKDYEEIEV